MRYPRGAIPLVFPSSTGSTFVVVIRSIFTGSKETPNPNCATPDAIKDSFSPVSPSRNVAPKTRASQYFASRSSMDRAFTSARFVRLLSIISKPSSGNSSSCASSFHIGASLASTKSLNFRLKETGEISPLPSCLVRGSLSRSGSPFGFEFFTSIKSSPVPLLINSFIRFFPLFIIFIRIILFFIWNLSQIS